MSKLIYQRLIRFGLCNCCLLYPTLAIGPAATSYTAGSYALSANVPVIIGDSVEAVTENSESKYY